MFHVEYKEKSSNLKMRNFTRQHKTFILFLGDILILYFSLFATLFVRYPHRFTYKLWQAHFYHFSVVYILWLIVFYFSGLYEADFLKQTFSFFKKFFQALAINVFVAIGFFYFVPGISPKRNLLFVIIFAIILFYLWRRIFYSLSQAKILKEKIAFIGLNQEGLEMINYFLDNPQLGYQVAFVLLPKKESPFLSKLPPQVKVYRGLSQFNRLLKKIPLDKAVIAMKPETNPVLSKELYYSSSNIELVSFPNFYEDITKKVPLELINRLWLQRASFRQKNLSTFIKRIADIFLALIGGILLILLLPFLIVAYLFTDGFPIFFTQARIGKNNKKFKIYKLRTMVKNADRTKTLWTEENDARVTPLGKFLRKFYIDELPQFINILKGEMSVIGPRPERPMLVKILEKEVSFYSLRHLVQPGVTGWAQINSFYARSMEDSLEKTKYDLYYVKNQSLFFDLSILFQTVKMIFSKRKKKNY